MAADLLRMFRPARLNYAQVCIWCGQRWCQSLTCVAEHDASWWSVCQRCEGLTGGGCDDCIHGVVPETSAAVAAQVNEQYVVAVVDRHGRQVGVVGYAA